MQSIKLKEIRKKKTRIEELVAHTSKQEDNIILLKTAPLTIIIKNEEVEVFALFDEASTITII